MAKNSKSKSAPKSVLNRRARFDYDLEDELVAGMVLSGPEVRAARDGHVHLKGAYVSIANGELWLNNASFSVALNEPGGPGKGRSVDGRPRKLLAHKKQIENLAASKQAGKTIVPVRMNTGGQHIKLVIAAGKGKRQYDKRETLKRRDQQRDAERAIRG